MLPSNTEAEILRHLSGAEEKYGLDIIEASEGNLKLGTLYVLLARLEQDGFVTSRQETETKPRGRGRPRSLYQITGAGRRAFYAYELARNALDMDLSGAFS